MEWSLNLLKERKYYNDIFYINQKGSNFNIKNNIKINKISLHFSFKKIHFNKKNFLLFLFILELLTLQKPLLTKSKKNILVLKLRKGSITGSKVTLRQINLEDFLLKLYIILPQLRIALKNKNKNSFLKQRSFAFTIKELYIFTFLEKYLQQEISNLNCNFSLNTKLYQNIIFLYTSLYLPLNFSLNKFNEFNI